MSNADRCRRYQERRKDHVNTISEKVDALVERVNMLFDKFQQLIDHVNTLKESFPPNGFPIRKVSPHPSKELSPSLTLPSEKPSSNENNLEFAKGSYQRESAWRQPQDHGDESAGIGVKPANETFGAWWQAYPEKVGKGAARKAFAKALTKTSLDQLTAGVERYKATKPVDRPWCNPATWLNQERWLDVPAPNGVRTTASNGRLDDAGMLDGPTGPPPEIAGWELPLGRSH